MSQEGVFNEAALEKLVGDLSATIEADMCGALTALVIRLGGDVTISAAEIEQGKRIMPDFLDHEDGKGVRIIIPTKAKAQ
jgi:hypothetical protein